MSGDKSVFSALDESFRDSVKFGNNSKVVAMGKGQVLSQTNRDFSQTIADVLLVPELNTNFLSIGQFQEKCCDAVSDGDATWPWKYKGVQQLVPLALKEEILQLEETKQSENLDSVQSPVSATTQEEERSQR
ncbi:hypothetical protein T459_18603 [Capsicum annuum]|uniref:Retrovirus-related Pol polyprotein from transposon TNT 1-94-like beta-barrel domain-containing protein n=1 Tax=Capsicum annuum TaxID=4072 RepID=A0A2G2YZL0_CAPAN|nr:hypothetical protein T459_18603 [Capsicum annuum]